MEEQEREKKYRSTELDVMVMAKQEDNQHLQEQRQEQEREEKRGEREGERVRERENNGERERERRGEVRLGSGCSRCLLQATTLQ